MHLAVKAKAARPDPADHEDDLRFLRQDLQVTADIHPGRQAIRGMGAPQHQGFGTAGA